MSADSRDPQPAKWCGCPLAERLEVSCLNVSGCCAVASTSHPPQPPSVPSPGSPGLHLPCCGSPSRGPPGHPSSCQVQPGDKALSQRLRRLLKRVILS